MSGRWSWLLIVLVPAVAVGIQLSRRLAPSAIDFQKSQPEVVTRELGVVDVGTPTELVAEISNGSRQSLTITDVKADCGRTTVDSADRTRTVPPGKTESVAAVFNAAAVGPFDRSLYVQLQGDEGQTVWRTFRFTGVVRPQVSIEPPAIHVERPGGSGSTSITVNFGEPLRLAGVELNPPDPFEAELQEQSPDVYRLTVRPRDSGTSTFVGYAFVRVEDVDRPRLVIPVRIGVPAGPTLATSEPDRRPPLQGETP